MSDPGGGIVPPYITERIERLNTIKRVLREQGLDDNGANPHSWRCENPDRYPDYCTCVDDVAVALLDALFPSPEPGPHGEEPPNPADVNAADLGLPTGLP
jgi:hypothetical protein